MFRELVELRAKILNVQDRQVGSRPHCAVEHSRRMLVG